MKTNLQTGYVGWICSYVPEELIHAAGFQPYRISFEESARRGNSKYLPSNFCPMVKKIAESFEKGEYRFLDGIVIANSCNAMIHLYNILKEITYDEQFVYFLDLPRKSGDQSVNYFTHQLTDMFYFLNDQNGYYIKNNTNALDQLKSSLKLYRRTQELLSSINYAIHILDNDLINFSNRIARELREQVNNDLFQRISEIKEQDQNKQSVLLLTGAMVSSDILSVLQQASQYPILPEICQGLRYFQKEELLNVNTTELEKKEEKQVLELVARTYLQKFSCPRFYDVGIQESKVKRSLELLNLTKRFHINGVVHHDLGFCDLSNYDFLFMNDLFSERNIPVLRLNSELGKTELGQIQTRLEAFCEMNLL